MSADRFDALRASVDAEELSGVLARALGRRYRLAPLAVKCTYPVYRGEAPDAPPVFVKVGPIEEWRRTADVLAHIGESGFFARFLTSELIEYHGYAVFAMEWRASTVVRPEDMTDEQADSFASSCARLSEALQRMTDVPTAESLPDAPEKLYGILSDYAARHPLAAKLLGGLLSLPVVERTYGNRPRAVIHGDFHSKNFGFLADGRMTVCDCDKMKRALACGDLANALVERFSCLGLSREARQRLARVTRRSVARTPWPREDFAVVCNVIRLEFAARRILKHPNAAWIAIDIWRRDRRIRAFLDCLKGDAA